VSQLLSIEVVCRFASTNNRHKTVTYIYQPSEISRYSTTGWRSPNQQRIIKVTGCTFLRRMLSSDFLRRRKRIPIRLERHKHSCSFLKTVWNTAYSASADEIIGKQVAQLSQTDRAAGWVSYGQKWKTRTGRQYFTDII